MTSRQVGNGRVPYLVAAVAMRATLARANAFRLEGGDRLRRRERVVLDAVLVLTASYSRLVDSVYIAQVADLAGYSESMTREALNLLGELGLIRWEPKRGVRQRSTLGLITADLGKHFDETKSADVDQHSDREQDQRSDRRPTSANTKKFFHEDHPGTADDDQKELTPLEAKQYLDQLEELDSLFQPPAHHMAKLRERAAEATST